MAETALVDGISRALGVPHPFVHEENQALVLVEDWRQLARQVVREPILVRPLGYYRSPESVDMYGYACLRFVCCVACGLILVCVCFLYVCLFVCFGLSATCLSVPWEEATATRRRKCVCVHIKYGSIIISLLC